MLRSVVPGHNNNRHLTYDEVENNIGGLPVTDNRLRDLFDSIDVDHSGTVSVDAVKTFFNGLEHFGVVFSEKDVEGKVRRYAATYEDALTYDEFACFVLRLAQW